MMGEKDFTTAVEREVLIFCWKQKHCGGSGSSWDGSGKIITASTSLP
jgi:hypothetical protein